MTASTTGRALRTLAGAKVSAIVDRERSKLDLSQGDVGAASGRSKQKAQVFCDKDRPDYVFNLADLACWPADLRRAVCAALLDGDELDIVPRAQVTPPVDLHAHLRMVSAVASVSSRATSVHAAGLADGIMTDDETRLSAAEYREIQNLARDAAESLEADMRRRKGKSA